MCTYHSNAKPHWYYQWGLTLEWSTQLFNTCEGSHEINNFLNYKIIGVSLGPEKKNSVLSSATDPSQKLSRGESWSGKHPILFRLGVFFFFFSEKWWKVHPNFVLLGAFQKHNCLKIWLTQLFFKDFTFQRATQQFFFLFWCYLL